MRTMESHSAENRRGVPISCLVADTIVRERLAEQVNHFPLDEADKSFLLRACRIAMEGYFSKQRVEASQFTDVPENVARQDPKVYVSLFCDGRVRGCQPGQKGDMLASVLSATTSAIRKERLGERLKRSELERTYIDITVLLEPEPIEHLNGQLSSEIELGVHSLSIHGEQGRAFFKSSVPITKSYSLGKTLSRLSRKAGLDPAAYKTGDVTINRYPTIQFAEELVDRFDEPRVRDLYRGSPLVRVGDVDRGSLEQALRLAAEYFKRHTNGKGRLTYEYSPATGEPSYSNSRVGVLRRAASTWIMADLAKYLNDARLLAAARRSIDLLLERHYQADRDRGFGYLLVKDTANVGSAGFVMTALTAIDDSELRPGVVEELVEFILAMESDQGFLSPMYLPDRSDARDSKHHYYPGEAMTGLMRLYERTGDSRCPDLVARVFPFYRAFFRATDQWINMAAWVSKPYAALFRATGEREYADFVLEVNDRVAGRQYGLDEIYVDRIGSFTRNGNTGATAVFLESVADGLGVARALSDAQRIERYSATLLLGMRYLLQAQYTPSRLLQHPHGRDSAGGFKNGLFDPSIRIDGVQHCSCAILETLKQLDLSY